MSRGGGGGGGVHPQNMQECGSRMLPQNLCRPCRVIQHMLSISPRVAISVCILTEGLRNNSEKLAPIHHIRSEFLERNLFEALC